MPVSTVTNPTVTNPPIDIYRAIKIGICVTSITIIGVPQFREPLRRFVTAKAPNSAPAQRNAIAEFFVPSLGKPAAVGDKVAGYLVTSPFGDRTDPITGEQRFHGGADVATPVGTPLFAIAPPGTSVIVSCANDPAGYGLFATYKTHQDEEVLLGHLDGCNPGEHQAGKVFARTGNTGRSTGPHLHAEIRTPQGERRSPTTAELWQTLRGDTPKPVLSR